MDQLTFPIDPSGLAVPVFIGLDGRTTKAQLAAGQPVPPPVLARGLLDTASSVSAVATWVVQRLALTVASSGTTQTASGSVLVNLFTVSLSITNPAQAGSPWLTEPDLLVMEMPTVLPDADVLVGLDVLLGCKLLLDGPAKRFTLEF
jgi:hypothetical protein